MFRCGESYYILLVSLWIPRGRPRLEVPIQLADSDSDRKPIKGPLSTPITSNDSRAIYYDIAALSSLFYRSHPIIGVHHHRNGRYHNGITFSSLYILLPRSHKKTTPLSAWFKTDSRKFTRSNLSGPRTQECPRNTVWAISLRDIVPLLKLASRSPGDILYLQNFGQAIVVLCSLPAIRDLLEKAQ